MRPSFRFLLCMLFAANAFAQDFQVENQQGPVLPVDSDYEETELVQVCTIPLPVTPSVLVNKAMLGTKHIYLKVGENTYGTPHTALGTYFGGDAYLYDGDPFFKRSSKGEKCYSIKRKKVDDDVNFAKRVNCIAKKLAMPEDSRAKPWLAIFDYHVMKNNCGAMVDYLVKCGEGKMDKKFNFRVGGVVGENKVAKLLTPSSSYGLPTITATTYGELCEMAKHECSLEDDSIQLVTETQE